MLTPISGGRLVWILTVYPLEQCVEHWKNLDVAIVVDGGLSVSFQMEGSIMFTSLR